MSTAQMQDALLARDPRAPDLFQSIEDVQAWVDRNGPTSLANRQARLALTEHDARMATAWRLAAEADRARRLADEKVELHRRAVRAAERSAESAAAAATWAALASGVSLATAAYVAGPQLDAELALLRELVEVAVASIRALL